MRVPSTLLFGSSTTMVIDDYLTGAKTVNSISYKIAGRNDA